MSVMHCTHSRITRAVATLLFRLFGRPRCQFGIPELCPICGLLPHGDRTVEYVLTVWFIDGDTRQFLFRGMRPKDCYAIAGGALTIHLTEATISYAMDMVCTVEFTPKVIPTNPVPTREVLEAEQIISGQSRK